MQRPMCYERFTPSTEMTGAMSRSTLQRARAFGGGRHHSNPVLKSAYKCRGSDGTSLTPLAESCPGNIQAAPSIVPTFAATTQWTLNDHTNFEEVLNASTHESRSAIYGTAGASKGFLGGALDGSGYHLGGGGWGEGTATAHRAKTKSHCAVHVWYSGGWSHNMGNACKTPNTRHEPQQPPSLPPALKHIHYPPRVTFRRVVVSLRGPGQSPVLPFACCVGSLRSVGRCGRCSCWCRFRVRGAQSLVCWGCAECGGMCRLRVSGAR